MLNNQSIASSNSAEVYGRCGSADVRRCGKHAGREMDISSRSGWSRFPFNVAFRTHFDITQNTVLQQIVHNQMPPDWSAEV